MHRQLLKTKSLLKWSCLGGLCGGGGGSDGDGYSNENNIKAESRFMRPFSISSVQHVKLANDAPLIKDQNLTKTKKGKNPINQDKVPLSKLKVYIEKNFDAELVERTSVNSDNIVTTKIIQNLYVTSLGGLKAKTLKNYKVNLLLNASIDLPMVEVGGCESLRVPISELEPESLSLYVSDVADKIHENYLKNGQTVIFCQDGNLNSMALSAGYLCKYTDLSLSEALTHLQFTRKGFELAEGNLEGFKKPLEKFAKKAKKPVQAPVKSEQPQEEISKQSKSKSSKKSGKPKTKTKKTAPKSGKSGKANTKSTKQGSTKQ